MGFVSMKRNRESAMERGVESGSSFGEGRRGRAGLPGDLRL
jgi:hypothetical protein